MTVISISVTESSEQLIAGFPKTVALETNIASTIFYTIDGSEPTNLSLVYLDPIVLPTDELYFIIKVFATNGIDSSPIITLEYSTNILENARIPHATVSNLSNNNLYSLYPFGTNSPTQIFDYLNSANAGTTVNSPEIPDITFGYDADGYGIGADRPLDNYLNIYSTTNKLNQTIDNIGNLPGKVTIIGRRTALEYNPEESNRSDALFDAKAMVIFQDITTEDPSNPPQINPQYFSLENLEIVKDGAPLRASGLDGPTITGSFLRSHYNPRTQMVTSYYRDSSTNRWIISTAPYEPKQNDPGNWSTMVFSRNDQGAGKVFAWNLFRYRTLT